MPFNGGERYPHQHVDAPIEVAALNPSRSSRSHHRHGPRDSPIAPVIEHGGTGETAASPQYPAIRTERHHCPVGVNQFIHDVGHAGSHIGEFGSVAGVQVARRRQGLLERAINIVAIAPLQRKVEQTRTSGEKGSKPNQVHRCQPVAEPAKRVGHVLSRLSPTR